ncbi:DSD1 family PLP-dependent enzyme [soil metagenome]
MTHSEEHLQTPPPAKIGMTEQEIDTPALVVDLAPLESNLDLMMRLLAPTGVKLRAHAKTHKSPVIAAMQIARGAVGQCVQKVSEAEALVSGGIMDVLISNEVVGAQKLARVATLAKVAKVAVCVDDARNVEDLERAAADAGARVSVLVEIDAGAGRCGIDPGEPAVALARRIAQSPHLSFGGLQAYQGGAQHMRTHAQREAAVKEAAARAARTIELLKAAGIACPIVGGGGTGTFLLEANSGVYTEVQAGSYIFMDADYGRNFDEAGAPFGAFQQSLFVLSTVMSAPRAGVAVLDAGLKSVSVDSGFPLVWNAPEVKYVDASDEHGKLEFPAGADGPKFGEKIRIVPGHCDPTVNLHDWYVGLRNGRVESVWPVAARGCFS